MQALNDTSPWTIEWESEDDTQCNISGGYINGTSKHVLSQEYIIPLLELSIENCTGESINLACSEKHLPLYFGY